MSEDSQELIEQHIVRTGVPAHVAIIMDGNGRWAAQRGWPRIAGHQKGVDSVREIIRAAGDLGVGTLTLYAFSEENWGRPEPEVNALFNLLDTFLIQEKDELMRNNVRLCTIGNPDALPDKSRRLIGEACQELSGNTGLLLNIALSYSGRSEIVHACRELAKLVAGGQLAADEIGHKVLESKLWTASIPSPDLLIRTSGEQRISNFLLWQIAYTELWFTPVFWPDFGRKHFAEALRSFQGRKRRYGLVQSSQTS
ncbi:MAG: isoprenyl transferase [Deltaproteobacteria bacterium]|nr:isoprenyl transferase [Deltaproteobacteria bacterium]